MGQSSRAAALQDAGGRVMVWFVVGALAVLLVGLAIVARDLSEVSR